MKNSFPFLNLSADSFRVTLADIGQTLPYLWTQKASLSVFGSAFALPVETSDARYFVAPGTGTTSMYNPVTRPRRSAQPAPCGFGRSFRRRTGPSFWREPFPPRKGLPFRRRICSGSV